MGDPGDVEPNAVRGVGCGERGEALAPAGEAFETGGIFGRVGLENVEAGDDRHGVGDGHAGSQAEGGGGGVGGLDDPAVGVLQRGDDRDVTRRRGVAQ